MKQILSVILIVISIFAVNAATYKMSNTGYEYIKGYETCSLKKYKDSKGYSIGWGHFIKPGESYNKISQKEADNLFIKDIQWVNSAINRLLKPIKGAKFSQNFIDGLGDLIYNCGEAGVKNSVFYKRLLACRVDKKTGKINQNDFNFTVAAVKNTHVYEPGHKTRRYNCHLLMLKQNLSFIFIHKNKQLNLVYNYLE